MRLPVSKVCWAIAGIISLAAAIGPVYRASPAWSAPAPVFEIRILGNVSVDKKQVYLTDICDPVAVTSGWKDIAGSLQIGDAPPAGSEKFIDPEQLRAYLVRLLESRGINPGDVKIDIPDKITVRRESVKITHELVESIFTKHVLANSPWKQQEVSVSRIHFTGLPVIPAGQMTYEVVSNSSKERFIGNVTASIEFYVNGEKARTLGVTGRVDVLANAYRAARPLSQNEIISPSDLEICKVNITDSPDRFAMLPEQVENRRVTRNIGMHQPIELKDLDKPLVLKRGDPVTIIYEIPGLQVTARGQANASGGVGDTMAVVNVSSKKTITCKVVDAQTVRAIR